VNIACSITGGNGAYSVNKKKPHTPHHIVFFDVDIDLHPVGNCYM